MAARVLCLMGGLDPAIGGPSASAPNIWLAARRAGLEVTCAIPVSHPPAAGETAKIAALRDAGIDVQTFPISSRLPKCKRWGISFPLALWVLRAARGYDIVQAHGAWMFTSVIGLIAARLGGIAFVLLPHETLAQAEVTKGRNPLKHLVKRAVRALYLRYNDFVVFASKLEQRDSMFPQARARSAFLYHPVVKDEIPPPAPRRWPSAIQTLRVGFIGRFDPKKNLELLLQAIGEFPASTLTIAGGGAEAYTQDLRAMAEANGIGRRTHWVGFISPEHRSEFFSSIDVLVMPSAYECFGMVAAEAMQHGLPVIVTKSTGVAEIVESYRCGIVVTATVEAVKAALESCRDGTMLEAFSHRALAACRQELSVSEYGRRLAAVYSTILVPEAPAS